jgi:hypothetical protein
MLGWLVVCLDGCLGVGMDVGLIKFMSKFVKFMAQNNLCQISADLCQNCIYPI